jgi:hypothetical protein
MEDTPGITVGAAVAEVVEMVEEAVEVVEKVAGRSMTLLLTPTGGRDWPTWAVLKPRWLLSLML